MTYHYSMLLRNSFHIVYNKLLLQPELLSRNIFINLYLFINVILKKYVKNVDYSFKIIIN